MSIRIGLYEFFAYTLPGAVYLLVVVYGLAIFGLVNVNLNVLNNLSSLSLVIFLGASYLTGLLLDPVAYQWGRLFRSRNREAWKQAYEDFQKQYPWLTPKFKHTDWAILLRSLKNNSTEMSADIEQLNVTSIMLRNVSLGLIAIFVIFLVYFFVVSANIWNLVLAGIAFLLSIIAMRRSTQLRHWFYLSIFEASAAQQLPKDKWIVDNRSEISKLTQDPTLELTDIARRSRIVSEGAGVEH